MAGARRIGLLGGSFNPAHRGHLHLTREALRRLGLDEVWWLVTPQNPLKKKEELAGYAQRFAGAQALAASEPRIRVTAVEERLGTRYTIDTLKALKRRHPRFGFVWLMGADNLAGFHRWRKWADILRTTPVAVFDRSPYSHRALHSPAALRFARFRLPERQLARAKAPAFAYIAMKRDATSATDLRKMLGK